MKKLILGAILSLLFIQTSHATTLNGLASEIAAQTVSVRCVASGNGWDGMVVFSGRSAGHVIYLTNAVCRPLNSFLTKPAAKRWVANPDRYFLTALAQSFSVLTHEAMHIRADETNEGKTECLNFRNEYRFTAFLKLSWKLRNRIYREMVTAHRDLIRQHPEYGTVC